MVAEGVEFKMPRERRGQKGTKLKNYMTKLRIYMKKLVHETQEGGRRITRVDECVKLPNFQDT